MAVTFILTCEHAGNEIPANLDHLFKGHEEVLYSHKAIDFGALRLAKHLETVLELPLYFSTVSRLVVEANRSLDNDALFSEYSKKLSAPEKQAVLEAYYYPHRHQVTEKIEAEIAQGNQVCQLAIHTFTPVMDGNVRKADIGILFDPEQPLEHTLAVQLQQNLLHQNIERKVLFNSPYLGTDDGFPPYLRKKFLKEQYAGFELEINQKFYLDGKAETWDNLMKEITLAIKELIAGTEQTEP